MDVNVSEMRSGNCSGIKKLGTPTSGFTDQEPHSLLNWSEFALTGARLGDLVAKWRPKKKAGTRTISTSR